MHISNDFISLAIREQGAVLEELRFGSISLLSKYLPDNSAKLAPEFSKLYDENPAYLNAVIAPNAGRISRNNQDFDIIEQNEGICSLHSGSVSSAKHRFSPISAELSLLNRFIKTNTSINSISLRYRNKPEESAGKIYNQNDADKYTLNFAYTLDSSYLLNGKCFIHSLIAISEQKNSAYHFNATSHNYYEIDEDTEVMVNAKQMFMVDSDNLPSTVAEELPFTKLERIFDLFNSNRELDNPFELNEENILSDEDIAIFYQTDFTKNELIITKKPAVTLKYKGQIFDIYTNQRYCIIYTANHNFNTHKSICFEFQYLPNTLQKFAADSIYHNFYAIIAR